VQHNAAGLTPLLPCLHENDETSSELFQHAEDLRFHADTINVVLACDTKLRSKLQNISNPSGHLLQKSIVTR
jgi:hypothetical protein